MAAVANGWQALYLTTGSAAHAATSAWRSARAAAFRPLAGRGQDHPTSGQDVGRALTLTR